MPALVAQPNSRLRCELLRLVTYDAQSLIDSRGITTGPVEKLCVCLSNCGSRWKNHLVSWHPCFSRSGSCSLAPQPFCGQQLENKDEISRNTTSVVLLA